MSFGSGGFGGFGQQNNNQQTSSGFGGFGANNNAASNTPGFGSSNSGAFGANSNSNTSATSSGMFGSANNNAGGFGASSGGFGANTGGGFGSKPAFGSNPPAASGSGGLFGSSTNNTTASTGGFGGFGGNTATPAANTSSPFGGGASGGVFGGAKTGFGATNANAGSSLFGGGATNTASSGFGNTGFGANNANLGGSDPPGTSVTPFQAFTEKELNSSTTNSFQNLLFQDPYKKWSAEELRLADYLQGRRHGNASGGGAFGVSSGFGGAFGATNNNAANTTAGTGFGSTASPGGLFGGGNTNNPTASTGFGSTTGGGFGNTAASGGLFGGANKPATGGLFGGSGQTQQQTGGMFGGGATGGGGFGAANNTSVGGFGAANTGNTGGGLFGASNQAQKPAGSGFSFGNTTNNAAGGGFGGSPNNAFGGANNAPAASGGLFGNTNNAQTGGGLFGNNQQQQQQQQQQNTSTGFGNAGQQNQAQQSGGLFGNSQAKPATGGLFGNTPAQTTGGGLFGNNNQQQQATSGFGTNNAGQSGGLFGAAKPNTGGGLFGTSNPAQNTNTGGTGLFGMGSNNQNQQTGGTGLFGASTNNQQQKPGPFGASMQSSGGGLFGGQSNQNQGSSLFGGSMNQPQQQNSGLGGSLLGNSQQGNSTPQGLTANLNDVSAYGAPALFSNVGGNEMPNPGPLATPLNGNSKPRRSSILPMYKLAPASASRFATPQKRGFGFSYSSYGTPGGSPASSISSTPGGLGRSLLGSSSSGSLSKSMSTTNLRRSFNAEDSILAPGAFSSSSSARWYGSTGSKKLVINRDIRSDLFSTPQKDKLPTDNNTGSRKLSKRVSFDTTNVEAETETPVRSALPAPEDTPDTQGDETPRQSRAATDNGGSKTPEMEQAIGNELAIVHEEDNSVTPEAANSSGFDNAPGNYWLMPSKEDLLNMNRMQRQRIDGFTVGRENVGYISFKIPVDISGIDLDDLCGGIIQLEPRSATVYPVSAKKPPVGKGLNVPAKISLEQSWPRGARDKRVASDPKKRFNKHVERLKRIPDTTFESYDRDTGVWAFSVEHFTTYGLDDSDDDEDEDMSTTAPMSGPATAEPQFVAVDVSMDSAFENDTPSYRQRRVELPGAFDEHEDLYHNEVPGKQSFLGASSADSAPNDVHLSLEDETNVDMGGEYDMSDDEDTTRSLVGQHLAAEHDDTSSEGGQEVQRGTPGGILRARMRAMKGSVGPVKLEVADGDDWMEMLRKTVSPVKRDRHLLRELNESPSKQTGKPLNFDDDQVDENRKSSIWGKSTMKDKTSGFAASTQAGADKGRGFATSIDLMNSLFEKPKSSRQNLRAAAPSKGFPQWPYERQEKTLTIDEAERSFHEASRPTWGPNETLVLTRFHDGMRARRSIRDTSDILAFQRSGIETETQDLRLAKFATESSKKFLRSQDRLTEIRVVDDVPMAKLQAANLKDVFHHQDMNDPAHMHEKRVWDLASILFDKTESSGSSEPEHLLRKNKLSQFWTDLVDQAASTNIGLAGSSEEKALACLAGHRITEACKHLLDGKNFRLGTLIPLIGTSDTAKKDMREQVKAWHDAKMLSEFTESIRTIYELLSGNVCVCEGMKGAPLEDRLESFVISKKFGLDWRQAFGLRLWYAISKQDDAANAVIVFKRDIDQDKEDAPRPWYAEQGLKALWDDVDSSSRQDLLWGLLQLYADDEADLEAIIRPENSQLSPLDMRVCWQLGVALASTGKVSFGQGGVEKADAATISYAAQLTSAGEWLEAIFVLLHLCDPKARMKAIQEHLCRHAGLIGPDSGPSFSILTEKFRIPAAWVWEALALYMRSVKKDASAEVQCLLRAGSFVEAHRILVQQVAPVAIIERDYAGLSSLISQFEGRQGSIREWPLGGEIYSYFLNLVQHRSKGETVPPSLVDRLMAGLNAMNEDAAEAEIVRFAAVSDMADETAREILKATQKKQDMELRSRILNLPLTQDRLLAYSVDLSLDRYREVMSH